MNKKALMFTIMTIVVLSAFLVIESSIANASTNNPASLKIYIGPASVLADNNTYNCIFVQLLDSSGNPTRAVQDTTISLSSSNTNVGTVDQSATIPRNSTYVSANFHSSFIPGTTTISAAASGFATVQQTVTTIGPVPYSIAVYGFPSTLPQDGNTYAAIMVQLQDSGGAPAKAPKGGVTVTLTCSDTSVGAVSPQVTILEGQTYAVANFTTTIPSGQNAGKTLSASVTAVSQGYVFGQLTISTTPIAVNPSVLKIFVGAPEILADQNSYNQVAIEIQNATGFVALAPMDLTINVTSSNVNVGKVASQLTIPQSTTYALATINTTYQSGSTVIYATGTNLQTAQASMTTFGFVPSKLAVYCLPSMLPSDNQTYRAIQVQLQDSQGNPAKDPQQNITVNLFSSQPTVAAAAPTLTIPFGQTQAIGLITVSNTPGTTTITAQGAGYSNGQATLNTYLIDYSTLKVTLTSSAQNTTNSNNVTLTAYVTANNSPITGVAVTFTSDNGGTFGSTYEQGNGYYLVNFTAPNFAQTTTATITATATETGYTSAQGTAQIIVNPAPAPTPSSAPSATATPPPNQTTQKGNSSTGTIILLIKDSSGNPLNNTLVTSVSQPTGMQTLTDVTNSSGYVTFQNATFGDYSFKIINSGYQTMNANVNLTSSQLSLPIQLVNRSEAASTETSSQLITVAIIVVIIIAAVVTAVMLFLRRRDNSKIRKLQEMQKQLKYES